MEEESITVRSTRTGREYAIKRHYDCQSSWLIYVVTCVDCQVQYIGQTIQTMVAIHYGHRSEVRRGEDGFGRHFRDVHGGGLDLSRKEHLEQCLQSFSLQIIASVRPQLHQNRS